MATLVLSAMAVSSRTLTELFFVGAVLIALYSLSGTGWKAACSGLRPFFMLLILTAVLQLLLTPGRSLPGFETAPVTITFEGLRLAVIIIFRISAVILASSHLITTTSPLELSRSLGWIMSPGRHLGLPISDLALILNLGFQFFPILIEESRSLRLALESRGISFRHPRIALRFRALTAWILALLAAVLERSHRLAVALEVKNFGHVKTPRHRFPSWKTESTAGLAVTVLISSAWLCLRHLPLVSLS